MSIKWINCLKFLVEGFYVCEIIVRDFSNWIVFLFVEIKSEKCLDINGNFFKFLY